MLKKFISFLMMGAVLLATVLPIQINAQSLMSRTTENKTSASFDLKQTLAGIAAEDSTLRLDVKKIEKDYYNSNKRRLSDGRRTALYVGIGAAIAAVVVIILVANKDDKNDTGGFAYAGCPGNPLCQ